MGDGADPHGPGRAGRLTGTGEPGPLPGTLAAGSVVTLVETWQGRVTAVRRVRVVEDVPHHHRAFYLAPGSRFLRDPRDPGEVRFSDGAWRLERRERERPVLSFAFPETPYAVLLTWSAEWRFEGYYVNIQSPLRERDGVLEYTDWFLDVHIPADRGSFAWKDEDELAEAVHRGLLSGTEADGVRWAGERAIEQVLLHEPPFDEDWSTWRPDPSWGPLEVPPAAD